MTSMFELKLQGCRATPLANYLKALAILRLVSDQKDPGARGWWEQDVFYLASELSGDDLESFFLEEYRPTPIVAPWNGGSGFYPSDRKIGIQTIRNSPIHRFACYRHTIELCEGVLDACGAKKAPSGNAQKDLKNRILIMCRSQLPDEALNWLDAAFVLTTEGASYPPLLGTGGNDGRLEFTNNFMQRLVELIDNESGGPIQPSKDLCRTTLWAEPTSGLKSNLPIGQFLPRNAGGANAGPGYDFQSVVNPWDFVLALEGALVFGASATKRLEVSEPGVLSGPFTVRPSLAGYASAAPGDKARAEMWLPIWHRPASYLEVKLLFSEGRSQIGRRRSRDGVDFARAVATLGVDRGISSFHRTGFIERNGQAYLASSLGRWPVLLRPQVNLLSDLDVWLGQFRRASRAKGTPASFIRCLRRIEAAILDVCSHAISSQWQKLLGALGEAESQMARSPQTVRENQLSPLPLLRPRWLTEADDGSPEFRLAVSLASVYHGKVGPLRANMIPMVKGKRYPTFNLDKMDDNDVVWGERGLAENLLAVLGRRLLIYREQDLEELPLHGKETARLEDIRLFIEGEVDESRMAKLLWGINALDWTRAPSRRRPRESGDLPVPSPYAVLKLLHFPGRLHSTHDEKGVQISVDPGVFARARSGQIAQACKLASRKLRVSGMPTRTDVFFASREEAKRIAAALLFPISEHSMEYLARMVIKPAIRANESTSTKGGEV